jgi:pentatricopeptide repeat protein
MPAALVLRACTRLELPVTPQAWTRRAVFLALRCNTTRSRSIFIRPYHLEAQPSVSDAGSQILSQLRPRNAAPNSPETQTAVPTHDFHTPSSLRDRKRDRDKYKAYGHKRGLGLRRSRLRSKNSHQHRLRKTPEFTQKATAEQRKIKESKKKRRQEAYNQWGYLRHQYSGDELIAVRRQFNIWKRRIELLAAPVKPRSWPWLNHGKFLYELESISDMRKAWHELDIESRKKIWPTAMLSTMHLCPGKAVQVLESTLDPLPQGYAILDVAHFCILNLRLDSIKIMRDRVTKADEVLELFAKLVEDLPSGHIPFRQSTLGYLAKNLPLEQAVEMLQILQRSGIKLHRNTLLHFARKLASNSTYKAKAFELLREIADKGHDLNSAGFASVVTTLLLSRQATNGWSISDESFPPQRALEYFLERGFSPNLINFTALVESLCLQGDITEAVRLPLLLAENGVELDKRCYTTVFRGAKASLKASNIQLALDVARAAKAPYVDVLNNTLHSIFYFAEMESRERQYPSPWTVPIFGSMLRIYAKKFDLEPLQWLLPDTLPLILSQEDVDGIEKFRSGPRREWEFRTTIVPVVNEFFERSAPRQEPNAQTLAIMLRAYIKTLYRPYDLMSFYSFFKSRLEEHGTEKNWGRELVQDQRSVVHDTLIQVMLERKSLLRPALQVFGDMLRGTLTSRAQEEGKETASPPDGIQVHPAPSLFTFSILLHGLLMRGEKMLGEQMLQVMREHNLEPNDVTWNTLVKGYASMQNLSQTVGTLQDLEAAGYKPDAYTFKAFSRLKDQTRALETMEKIIDENKKRLEQHHSQ